MAHNGPGPYEGIYSLADAIRTGIMNIAGWMFARFGTDDARRAFLANTFPDSPPSLIYQLHDQMASSLSAGSGIMSGGQQSAPIEDIPGGHPGLTYQYIVDVPLANPDRPESGISPYEVVIVNDQPLTPSEIAELARQAAMEALQDSRILSPGYYKGWEPMDDVSNYTVTGFYITRGV